MRYLIAALIAVLLGGCVVLPGDYDDDYGHGYYGDHHYWGGRHEGFEGPRDRDWRR
jgi:hypothetical protein